MTEEEYFEEGYNHIEAGRYKYAVECYRKAIEIDPKYANAYNDMGVALDDLGRKEEAVASYKKAIEIDPKYAMTYNNMGFALSNLGRFD